MPDEVLTKQAPLQSSLFTRNSRHYELHRKKIRSVNSSIYLFNVIKYYTEPQTHTGWHGPPVVSSLVIKATLDQVAQGLYRQILSLSEDRDATSSLGPCSKA